MILGADNSVTTTDLIGLVRFLTGISSSSNVLTAAQIKGLLNNAQREFQTFILSNLKFGLEENATPATGNGSIDLVAGTTGYSFPTDMLTLDRLEICYTTAGLTSNDFYKVSQKKQESIDGALSNTTDYSAIVGSKTSPYYWLYGGKIYLDPVPDTAVTGGLKVWYTSTVTDLTSSSDEPVFVEAFHPVLSYKSAIEFLLSNDKEGKAQTLKQELVEKEARAIAFYSSRDTGGKAKVSVKKHSYK